jgi:hypothetical protein
MSLPLRNIHVETPYPIDRIPDQLHYTYLDTFGRPVLVASKNNLVEQHIQDVVVSCKPLVEEGTETFGGVQGRKEGSFSLVSLHLENQSAVTVTGLL